MYVEGTAVVLGFEDPMLQTDDTPIKRCLQTKWPYIELLWTTERSPSLNWCAQLVPTKIGSIGAEVGVQDWHWLNFSSTLVSLTVNKNSKHTFRV